MKLIKNLVVTDIDALHKVSEEVNMVDVATKGYVRDMLLQTYKKLNGAMQGMAAIQVSLPWRAILLRYKKGDEPVVVFNPRVTCSIGRKKSNEGCLSEGDGRWIVKRPVLMRVEYYTFDNERIVEWLPYKKARIFKHEVDHLNGILLQDIGKKVSN